MSSSRTIGLIGIVIAALLVAGGVIFFLSGEDDEPGNGGNGNGSGSTATSSSGSGTPGGGGSTPTVDTPEALLDATATQWDDTETAHFALQIDGKAYIDDAKTLELRSASGDIARPDLVEATAKISVALVSFDIGIIALGETMYQTNLVTGDWELAPDDFDYNPAVLFSPTDGISAVVRKVQSPAFGGNESVEGRHTRIVTGTLAGDDVRAMTAGALEGDVIETTLWIATDTPDIMKVVLRSPATDGDAPTVWTLVITRQNDPVTIEAPEV